MTLENISGKDFRMIKGGVRFYDPFDEHIVSLAITPDVKVMAGEKFQDGGIYFASRLAKMDPVDVTVFVCIEGVVYSDGSRESFK